MNAVFAIMAREVMARRELLLLAVALAVSVSLLPFLPSIENYEATDVRTAGCSAVALALGWFLALLLGATVFGNDLSEGRLGFFFARPVGGLAVWWGRILAVLTLIWVVELIILLPSFYGGWNIISTSREGLLLAAFGYLVMPSLLLLLAHAVSIMVRARDAWLFLDLAGVVVFAIIAWFSLLPFLFMFPQTALWVIGGGLIAALLFALSVGGAIGVAVGRVDLRRTHGALSLALWATLAVCLAGITAYSSWLRDFGPPDFDDIDVLTVAPDGRWVEVLGGAPRRLEVRRRCLVSTIDNRWIPLPAHSWVYSPEVVYSRDGSTALWLGAGFGDEPRVLWWADLGRQDPSARSTKLVVAPEAVFTLSPDGARMAILENGTISVFERDDERLMTAVRLPEDLHRAVVIFSSRDRLRLFSRLGDHDGHSLFIANADVTTGKVIHTGEIERLPKESWFVVDADVEYLVMWTRAMAGQIPVKSVYDAANGDFIANRADTRFQNFLSDGRLVDLDVDDGGQARLVVESVDEGDRLVQDLGNAKDLRLSGEALPGAVAVSRPVDPSDSTKGLRVDLIDVDSGQVQIIGAHLRRAVPWFRWLQGNTQGIFWYGNQPATSRLFINQTGALVRWDADTGNLIHVVGGRE